MTLVLPEQMFGKGQTESFRIADPKELLEEARKSDKPLSPLDYSSLQTATKQRQQRLSDLGLSSLAAAEARVVPLEFARTIYTELLGETLAVWRKFLPQQNSLYQFTYDSIPDEALGHIEDAKTLNCFDSIEIWSPQGNDLAGRQRQAYKQAEERRALARSSDPMAVGIITDANRVEHRFAITRWGESLMPFEAIKQFVDKVDREEDRWLSRMRLEPWGILAVVVAAVFVAVFGGNLLFGLAPSWMGYVVVPVGIVSAIVGMIAIVAAGVKLSDYVELKGIVLARRHKETTA